MRAKVSLLTSQLGLNGRRPKTRLHETRHSLRSSDRVPRIGSKFSVATNDGHFFSLCAEFLVHESEAML